MTPLALVGLGLLGLILPPIAFLVAGLAWEWQSHKKGCRVCGSEGHG